MHEKPYLEMTLDEILLLDENSRIFSPPIEKLSTRLRKEE